jgi:hypothetical protein
MKILFSVLIVLSIALSTSGQNSNLQPFQKKNSFQLDLVGPTVFYSMNYERIVFNGGRLKTSAQLGISYYPPRMGMRDIWFPMGINEVISFGNHHFEAGIGYMPIREAYRYTDLQVREWFWSHMATGRIGYRYQKPGGRLILRAAFTPVLEIEILGHGDEFHPLGGVSVGYSF